MSSEKDISIDPQRLKRAYKVQASFYDKIFNSRVFVEGRKRAIELLAPSNEDSIIDVGAGTGLNLLYFRNYKSIVETDFSYEMLSKAYKRAQILGINAEFIIADACALPFENGSFDCAIASYVISAVPKPIQVLKEMKRVVKKGGRIVIINHFRSENNVIAFFEDLVEGVCSYLGWKSNLPFEETIHKAGLIPIYTEKVNFLNGWTLALFIVD